MTKFSKRYQNTLTSNLNNNLFQTTTTAVANTPFSEQTSGGTHYLISACLNSVQDGLWTWFSPTSVLDITVKYPYPKMNIFTRDGCTSPSPIELVMDMATPYVTEDMLDIEANDELNSILITSRSHQETEDVNYLLRDLPRSSFKQEIVLPTEHYSVKDVKADLRNGVLRLVLPRKTPLDKNTTRKIKIS